MFFWGLYHWIDLAALPRSRSYFEVCATGNCLLKAIKLYPANIYFFKVNNAEGVKYVQI